jgi:phosphotransferase system  glucose/maltose/N-acetylglucosamine-specific IIC component
MKQKASPGHFSLLIWITALVFVAWWLYINLALRSPDHNNVNNQIFGATYGVLSIFGGAIGIVASKKWGGRKSLVGRALLFFAIGLLAQEFGQLTYSYYTYVSKVAIPYPSVGDVGYFGSVLFYIYAAWQLAKTAGVKFSLKDRSKKIIATALPLILLASSYLFFLRSYQFDFSSFKACLTVFLDFGYPLGQAIYIAIALMTYLLSKGLLGGIMRNKILFVLFALFIQYIADFSFLNAAKSGSPFPAGANDLMYLIAYTVMALALNSFRISLIKAPKPETDEA